MTTMTRLTTQSVRDGLLRPALGALLLLALAGCFGSSGTGLTALTFKSQQTPVQALQCLLQSLPVMSHFDDGSVENATQTVEYSSSDPSIVRVSNGDERTPSGILLPKGTITAIGQGGDTAIITAALADRSTTINVVIRAARLQLTPAKPSLAEGTRIALHPTLIIGAPGDQQIARADKLVRYSITNPKTGDTPSTNLLTIEKKDNNDIPVAHAIAGHNDKPDGTTTALQVTASSDSFNADQTGPCAAGTDSIPLTVHNEQLQSLKLDIAKPSVTADNKTEYTTSLPHNVSTAVTVIGQFSNDYQQNLTSLATLTTSDKNVARVGVQGEHLVTTQDNIGASADITASFDQGLGSGPVTTSQSLTVSDERLDSLVISPSPSATILPQTNIAFQAVGTFASPDGKDQRYFKITRSIDWSLTNATGDQPDPDQVSIGNDPDAQGVVIVHSGGLDPVTVHAKLAHPTTTTPVDSAKPVTTKLHFDGQLDALTIDGSTPIGVNQVEQLIATGTLIQGDEQTLTGQVIWSSSDPDVAVVSDSPYSPGRLTPMKTGTAVITARYDNITATFDITVQDQPPPPPDQNPGGGDGSDNGSSPGDNSNPDTPPPPCTIPNPLPFGSRCLVP